MNTFPIPFSLKNPWKFPLHGLPLRCSIPFPEGTLRDPAAELILLNEDGRDCEAQWRVLSSWDDGSVRFALLNYAEATIPPRETRTYEVRARDQACAHVECTSIAVTEEPDKLTVDTGRLAWQFSRERFSFSESICFDGTDWTMGQTSDLCILDDAGKLFRASEGEYRIFLEESGPYRVVVRMEGAHGSGDARFMDYMLRFHFTAGGSQVLVMHHIRNRHGGRAGRTFRRCWLEGALNMSDGAIRRILHTSHGLMTCQYALECPERVDIDVQNLHTLIRDGTSLRENDEDICYSINEQNPDKARGGDRRKCSPLIDLHEPGKGGMLFRFTAPDPNAESPMSLSSERNGFEIDFFPEGEEIFHLGEGMGKTRDVLFNFHDDSLATMELIHESANLSYPGVTSPGAQFYRNAQFADVHRTLVPQRNKYPLLESKIDMLRAAMHGNMWPVASGWKHHGDEVGGRGRLHMRGIYQYINNEEDYLYCCMLDAWRYGHPFGALAMARHIMDIDYIDFSEDPARDGATCPHSEDHVIGEVYASHQWCQGLLYFYLATGDEEALRISKRIGDCLCWWITGPRKNALRSTGRETAWPLLSLSALYEATHEKRYRDAALSVVDELIRVQEERGSVVWEHPMGSGIYSDYMLAMTFNGIWDVWAATKEERVLQLWKDITGPVVDELDNPDGWGYVHFRNWHIKCADLTVLVRWYELTGDERYIRLGKNGLRLILAGCPGKSNQSQGFFAMWYRHIILFLKYADEFGMIDDDHCTLVW